MSDTTKLEGAGKNSKHPIQRGTKARLRSASNKTARTKTARLEALLSRARGATLAQLQRGLGWQPHTVRAAVSRLRKAGHTIELEEMKGRKAYRLAV